MKEWGSFRAQINNILLISRNEVHGCIILTNAQDCAELNIQVVPNLPLIVRVLSLALSHELEIDNQTWGGCKLR